MANTIEKVILAFGRGQVKEHGGLEFSWRDETGKEHFIGILRERRKKPKRITKGFVLNWGWKVIGNSSDVNDNYFVQGEM